MTTELHTNGHHSFDALLDTMSQPEPPRRSRPKAVTVPASTPSPAPAPEPQPAIIALADDTASLTARLARSLGVPTDAGSPTPSMFLAAIEKVHDALNAARTDLGAWADELAEKQRALEAREKAVERREAEAAASLALARLAPPSGRPAQRTGWLAKLWRRR